MSHTDAQNILDMRRQGANMPEAVVTRALQLTGDLERPFTVSDAMRELSNEACQAA